jgi:hypothetical protein
MPPPAGRQGVDCAAEEQGETSVIHGPEMAAAPIANQRTSPLWMRMNGRAATTGVAVNPRTESHFRFMNEAMRSPARRRAKRPTRWRPASCPCRKAACSLPEGTVGIPPTSHRLGFKLWHRREGLRRHPPQEAGTMRPERPLRHSTRFPNSSASCPLALASVRRWTKAAPKIPVREIPPGRLLGTCRLIVS